MVYSNLKNKIQLKLYDNLMGFVLISNPMRLFDEYLVQVLVANCVVRKARFCHKQNHRPEQLWLHRCTQKALLRPPCYSLTALLYLFGE